MHGAQEYFFTLAKKHFPEYFEWATVLENGGSVNINGTIRKFYDYCAYTGVDLGSGPCVDIICDATTVGFSNNSFDVVVSSELYEHTAEWAAIFINSRRMVKDDGLMLFTCAGKNRPEHGTTRTDQGSSQLSIDAGKEHYGNLEPSHFEEMFNMKMMFGEYQFYDNQENYDLYFIGFPTRIGSDKGSRLDALTKDIKNWLGDKLVNV